MPAQNWKINRSGTSLSFADKTGALLGGVTRVTLHSRDGVRYTSHSPPSISTLDRNREPELVLSIAVADELYVSASGCETNRAPTASSAARRSAERPVARDAA